MGCYFGHSCQKLSLGFPSFLGCSASGSMAFAVQCGKSHRFCESLRRTSRRLRAGLVVSAVAKTSHFQVSRTFEEDKEGKIV